VEAAQVTWRPLGELFVARGLITEAELDMALEEQAATGKRLGEILVECGLVSGPDLTSVLMDQLGVEVAKEEGFGSGLWAEIKRRHRRVRQGGEDEPDEESGIGQPELALLAPYAAREQDEAEPETDAEHGPESEAAPEPVVADEELDEIWAEYEAPSAVAPEPEAPELEEEEHYDIRAAFAAPMLLLGPGEPEPEAVVAEPEPVPALGLVTEPWSAPDREPEVAESQDTASLRAELEAAREDVARLHGMLADAMTALTALSAATGGPSYAE
jgi:hypothetical protein